MQVSQSNDFISHAVIGGMAPINFSISNSAEFFHILSSTLYSDQILAVVREVLCNAWDAHIAAGVTDKPIEITIKDNKLIIKDFGHGISPDSMGELYGTYGGTNKKNDGNQTGGFGLGCKAPFAYTDHFEVQSCHNGIKTIYSINRSCAKVMGIPSIIPIVKMNTEDTGLQVTIVLQSKDINRFTRLIEKIVYQGEMSATLNGNLLEKLGFHPDKENNYLAFLPSFINSNSKISIRYGNVIYPVPNTVDKLEYEQNKIRELLNGLSNSHTYNILFQAPANSISVTPSRESLSMQDNTITTLKEIFNNFINYFDSNLPNKQSLYIYECIDRKVIKREIPELLKRCDEIVPKPINPIDKINSIDIWSSQSVNFKFRRNSHYVDDSISYRINVLKEISPIKKSLLDSVLNYTDESKQTWLNKFILMPVIKKMLNNPLMDYKKFNVIQAYAGGKDTLQTTELVAKIKLKPEERLPYLRNIVFLSSVAKVSRQLIVDELKQRKLGDYFGFCFYHLSRKVNEAEAARQFFKDSGMIVIDLSLVKPTKIKSPETKEKTETKKRTRGLPLLSAMMVNNRIRMSNRFNESVERIIKPEFVVLMPKSSDSIGSYNQKEMEIIIKYFGYKGGIASTSEQYYRYLENGAIPINDYLIKELSEYIKNSKEIWEYQKHNRSVEELRSDRKTLVNTILYFKPLCNMFGIYDNRTQKDIDYLDLFLSIIKKNQYVIDYQSHISLYKDLISIPFSEEINNLFEKVRDNPAVDLISTYSISSVLYSTNSNYELKALAINLLYITLTN